MKNMKKMLALLLAVVLVLGMFPVSAFAEDTAPTGTTAPVVTDPKCENCGAEGHTADTCEACTQCKQTGGHAADCALNPLNNTDPTETTAATDPTETTAATDPTETTAATDPTPVCTKCGGAHTDAECTYCIYCQSTTCVECGKCGVHGGDHSYDCELYTCPDCGKKPCKCPTETTTATEPTETTTETTVPTVETCEYCSVVLTEDAVHAEDCLSKCTCEGDKTVEGFTHAEGCPLASKTCEYCSVLLTEGAVHAENCLSKCTCEGDKAAEGFVHAEGCPLYAEPEAAGPQVGDKIWIKHGSAIYKKTDDSKGHTLPDNCLVTITAIVDDQWYEFEFADMSISQGFMQLIGCKFVKIEDTSVQEPDQEPETIGDMTAEQLQSAWTDYSKAEKREALAYLQSADGAELYGEFNKIRFPELVDHADSMESIACFVDCIALMPELEQIEKFESAVKEIQNFYANTGLDIAISDDIVSAYENAYNEVAAEIQSTLEMEYPAEKLNAELSDAFVNAMNCYYDALDSYEEDLDAALEENAVFAAAWGKANALVEAKPDLYNNGMAMFKLDGKITNPDTLDVGTDVGDILANDNVEIHLFNYGSDINNRAAIGKDGIGWLRFSQSSGYDSDGDKSTNDEVVDGANTDTTSSGHPLLSNVLVNGYPNIETADTAENGNVAGSLKYLFDKESVFVRGAGTLTSYDQLASLKFTENASYRSMHFAAQDGDSRLFKNDGSYYYYYSNDNAAWFNPASRQFEVYNTTVMPKYVYNSKTSRIGNFLPFNQLTSDVLAFRPADDAIPEGTAQDTINSIKDSLTNGAETMLKHESNASRSDMWFGMTAEFDFYQPKDGYVGGQPMIFEFIGDDDVWVYIDDVLVLDIGSTHAALTGSINFADGTITDESTNNGIYNATLKEAYQAAYESLTDDERISEQGKKIKNILDNGFDGNTFKDYTEHEFKFFYLERGGNISTCKLKFNMEPLPEGQVTVEKIEENLNDAFKGETPYVFTMTVGGDSTTPKAGVAYKINSELVDNQASSGVTDANGQFVLYGGQKATLSGLTVNDTFWIEEATDTKYDGACLINGVASTDTVYSNKILKLTDEGASGSQADIKSYNLRFTNTWKTADLTVTKNVIGAVGEQDFSFVLKYDDTHKFEFTLKNSGSKEIKDLPVGYIFTLTETDPSNGAFRYQAPKYNDEEVAFNSTNPFAITIAEGTNSVAVTNRCLTDLKIVKNLTAPAMEDQTFLFHIDELNMDVALVVKKGETTATAVVKDVVVGTYNVSENPNWAWRYEIDTTAQAGNSQTANVALTSTEADNHVTFTNKRTDPYWLSGDCYCENWWGAENGTEVEAREEHY